MILANNGWCALKEQKKEKVGKKMTSTPLQPSARNLDHKQKYNITDFGNGW